MGEFKILNVNCYVWVKLTKVGLEHLKSEHEKLKSQIPGLGEFNEPIVDDEGYSKFQLHTLMNHFGKLMTVGCELPFDTDVRFSTEDLR